MSKRYSSMKLCIGLLLSAISLSAHSANLFAYKSEAGEVIGRGVSNSYDDSNANFSITDYPMECILLVFKNSSFVWDITLHPPIGKKFEPKTYKNAKVYPSPDYPLLNISSNGLACNTSGEFKVLEVEYDSNNNIVKLAVDFVQRCENFKPALYGAYRYNSSIPNDLNDYIKSLN